MNMPLTTRDAREMLFRAADYVGRARVSVGGMVSVETRADEEAAILLRNIYRTLRRFAR
jgi:hypothetical protein